MQLCRCLPYDHPPPTHPSIQPACLPARWPPLLPLSAHACVPIPSHPHRVATASPPQVLHNVFWSTSGIAIWTGFENVFAFLWATGRLPYASDVESLTTPWGLLKFAAAIVCIPLWRGEQSIQRRRTCPVQAAAASSSQPQQQQLRGQVTRLAGVQATT